MPSHMIDSVFFRDLFGSEAMRAIFDDVSLLQKWLDVEAAIARGQARAGLIPDSTAEEITRQAHAENMDVEAIKHGIDQTVHPLVSVIWQLAEHCAGDAGGYVHWGATTQDVMDTAIILQLRDAYTLVMATLDDLLAALRDLAIRYQHTPIAARTHGQQALPTTFGYKVAVWLAEAQRHRERFQQLYPRLMVGEYGGAVGTLAGLNEDQHVDSLAVQRLMMAELGLNVPLIAWHTSRDHIVEFAHTFNMLVALTGHIAHEVIDLQKREFGELEEPFEMGKIGSSTMPQKRNPMICEAILTLARLCREKASTAVDTLLYNEHERDWSSFQMEWVYLAELFVMGQRAVELTLRVLRGLIVYPDQMRANLDRTQGLLLAERVMFALGEHIGRQAAHDVVYRCAMRAFDEGRLFLDVLCAEPLIRSHLSRETLASLLDPVRYTGLAAVFVERVTSQVSMEGDKE
jgi:3-carboxy-cis,cis-muconate cycloisomerase